MHSLKLKKEKYKELYAFRKEKKERRKKRDICSFTLPTWLDKAGSLKAKERKKKEERKKRKKKKKERHFCLRLSAGVI